MPQPISNTTTIVSGSLLANQISYVVDGQGRNYRGGFDGLSWMSEVPAENNVIFIGNTTSIGRGPVDSPLFYSTFNNTEANVIYAVNNLPGSPGNLLTLTGAYDWAATNNFFINNSDNPIPRINADGMVLFVDGGQPTSYPQTGGSWYDLSGNGNTGALTNSPTWDSNGWFDFDGVDDYSITSANSSLNSNTRTFQVLFKPISTTSGYTHLATFANGTSSTNRILLTIQSGKIQWHGWGTDDPAGTTTIVNGRWYLATYTYDYNTKAMQVYTNGTLESSIIDSQGGVAGSSTNNWYLAYFPGSFNGATYGNVDIAYFKQFNKVLSTEEVKQNYYQAPIVTDGLVLAVDAGNLVSYENGSTTTYSLTGSNSGSLINGTGFSSGNGGSWVFDGTNDYILGQDSNSLSFGNGTTDSPFSVECWVKIDSFDGGFNHTGLVSKDSGNPNREWVLLTNNSGRLFRFFIKNNGGDSQQSIDANEVIQFGEWYHVIATYDGQGGSNAADGIKIYVNGYEPSRTNIIKSSYTAMANTSAPLRLGQYANGNYLDGKIGNARVYNKELTATEVFQNYEATKYKFQGQQIVENGLVLNLDSANKDSYPGTGTTWNDLSGNNNNGTLINGVVWNPILNGGSMTFDGVDDTVSTSNNTLFESEGAVSLWFSRSGNDSSQRLIRRVGTNSNRFYLLVSSNNILCVRGQNISRQAFFSSSIGEWVNVTWQWRSSDALQQIYINGNVNYNGDFNPQVSGGDTTFGLAQASGGETWFGGNVATAKVYNRILSATEILQNYNATKTRFGL